MHVPHTECIISIRVLIMPSKKKLWGENKWFMFYIRNNLKLETLYSMNHFHAFEKKPIDYCTFEKKAAFMAMIRHGMGIT